MKKLIVSLLAVAGMVACSNEDVVRKQAGEAIGFSGAFVENATRAANDPSITTGSIDAFRVWAFMDEVSGEVLKNELVTKGEDGLWRYENIQYWMPGHTYYFAALAPVEGYWTLNTEAANTYGAGIVDFINADGSEDLLYAATSVESKLNDNAPVKFLFNHLLSKIKFTFVNGFTTENVTVKVNNVTMTAPASGSINLAVENWWDNNEDWVNLPENNDLTLAFGDVETLTAVTNVNAAANERLTIPASAERQYVVNFDVVVYSGNVPTEFHKTATIKDVAFEMGKAYNLKATIDHETLNLEEIVFDEIEVKEWIDGDEYEFEFTDREESEEPETPAEPAEPAEPEFVIPGEGVAYAMDYRYPTLVDGLDANNQLRVAQENGWIWDIHFNTGLASIEAGDYTAVHYFSSNDAFEVDTYNGGFQNNSYNYIYPDEFDKVTTFNVQKEGDYYCITMIGSGGYGNDKGTFRCVYIGKIKEDTAE